MKIYFIQQGQDGPIKIGLSWDVNKRMHTAKTFSPHPLRILGMINGGLKEERALHRKFKKERLEGEWFSPSEKLIQYLQTLEGVNPTNLNDLGVQKLITPLELAKIIQIQPKRILSMAKRGKIPYMEIKGAIYFKENEIEQWIQKFEASQNPPQSEKVVQLRP
jgi:hypothetical protein